MSDRILGIFIAMMALAFFASATQLETPFFSDPVGPKLFPYIISTIAFLASFYPFIIVDQKIKDPILGLKKSFIMVINNFNLVFSIHCAIIIANLLIGSLTLLIGLIVSLPVSLLLITKLYLFIKNTQSA